MRKRVARNALCVISSLMPMLGLTTPPQRYKAIGLCEVLKAPSAYANKKVTLRGSVYMGMENTNISDHQCPGKAIELKVGDDVYEHADIRSFHRKIAGWQMHGYATVSGTFSVTDSPLTPFVLTVEHVSNVAQYDKD
jgi:hypothetical protein